MTNTTKQFKRDGKLYRIIQKENTPILKMEDVEIIKDNGKLINVEHKLWQFNGNFFILSEYCGLVVDVKEVNQKYELEIQLLLKKVEVLSEFK